MILKTNRYLPPTLKPTRILRGNQGLKIKINITIRGEMVVIMIDKVVTAIKTEVKTRIMIEDRGTDIKTEITFRSARGKNLNSTLSPTSGNTT